MSTKYLAGIWGLQWFYRLIWKFSSVWLLSHVPMDYSTPGFPVHHQLLELAQTHVHWVGYPHSFSQFSCSVVSDSLWPHGLQHTRLPCPSPTPETYSKSSIKSVMPSNRLILCCPLLLLPSIFSSIRVFSNESVLHIRWPNYWSFTFSISPSNECSWLVSFRIDWFDILAV